VSPSTAETSQIITTALFLKELVIDSLCPQRGLRESILVDLGTEMYEILNIG
jgi:hypothetical protein